MKKFLLLIIGLVSLTLSYNVAYADDCKDTLYENVFACKAKSTYSYCTLEAKMTRSGPSFNIYESTYCNTIRDNDDFIHEAVAEQFKAEDPKMNKDKVKMILDGRIFESYERVKTAYDREKIMYQTRQSLIQQFQASEMWYNGTLDDSPFDLITDLNLIEIVLFGSEAEWNDDVWNWPKSSDDSGITAPETGAGQTPKGAGTPKAGESEAKPEVSGESPDDEYECVEDDILKTLLGGGVAGKPVIPPPGVIPNLCGNNKLDSGEGCDDGNNKAGDGCSESCKKEEGADLSCKDNEAVTFKQLAKTEDKKTDGKTGDAGDKTSTPPEKPPLSCPSGSSVAQKPTTQAGKEAKTKQDPNYPGPFVGGVLKNYPPSEKTNCAPGETYTEVTTIGGASAGTCFPTKLCTDFEGARKKLFGDDYINDPVKKEAAGALEIAVCIEVLKVTRPESPYPLNEGCIDCNILAMNDIMTKMLDKNVVPLQNSMQSWGSSNRWGPTVSFNLNTLSKSPVKPISSPLYAQGLTDKEKADLAMQKSRQDAAKTKDPNAPADPPQTAQTESVADVLDRYVQDVKGKIDAQNEFLKNYQMAGDANADQGAYGGIISKLRELQASFEKIQSKFMDLSLSTHFQEKEKCSF